MSDQQSNNRVAISQQALDLFAAHGFDAIGVQEICVAAGVTKPTLYHYFGNKRGLLETLVAERAAPLLRELTPVATYGGDLPVTLERVVATYFRFSQREPTLYRLLLAL